MRHEVAQRSLSEAMDGGGRVLEEVAAHVSGCARCTSFERGAWRLRELSRFAVAPEVPDLAGDIMARVREEAEEAPRRLLAAGSPPLTRRRAARPSVLTPLGRAAVIALLVGFVSGAIVTRAALIQRTTVAPALARQIPSRLLGAAEELRGYRATFDVTELNWTRSVSRRSFVADVAFRAPESFQVKVRDTTRYPPGAWPRNDLRLVTDGPAWSATGPEPCPRGALPACPRSTTVTRRVINRAPFDTATAMPTDVIVPMTVLAASGRVDVVSEGAVAGREAVVVRLSAEDGASLFHYVQFAGSWRPFFPQDLVVLWLDRTTWFPLRYEVFPAPGVERSAWATQHGLPDERDDRAIFTASVRRISLTPPPVGSFTVPRGRGASDQGFRDRASVASSAIKPAWTGGLSLWRAGTFTRTAGRSARETVLAYARGLSWLTVTQVGGWDQKRPFGVGPFAEHRSLPGGTTALYEPASSSDPRRLSLHTPQGEFVVAGNLPRATLERVAASLPVSTIAEPRAWRVHRWAGGVVEDGLTVAEGLARVDVPTAMPTFLPTGYAPAGARVARGADSETLTIAFRRAAAELGGVGLVFTQGAGQSLAPPSEPGVLAVRIGVAPGRWSPSQHLLEWTDGRAYRSLSSSTMTLSTLLRIAESLRPPVEGPGT
jgi:hypothetical protein